LLSAVSDRPDPAGYRRENGRRVEDPLEQRVLAVIRQAVADEDYSFGEAAPLLNRFALRAKRGREWTAGRSAPPTSSTRAGACGRRATASSNE